MSNAIVHRANVNAVAGSSVCMPVARPPSIGMDIATATPQVESALEVPSVRSSRHARHATRTSQPAFNAPCDTRPASTDTMPCKVSLAHGA